jgi:hypothetical protein
MEISKKAQSKSIKVIADGLNVSNQKQSLDLLQAKIGNESKRPKIGAI